MKNGVGVLIVTYNRISLLSECVNHVLEQELVPDRIIIVDNASADDTPFYLKELEERTPFVSVVRLKTNGGGAAGFKIGLKVLNEDKSLDWYLLIDDDAMIEKGFIKQILNAAKENPDVEAFSGTVLQDGQIDYDQRRSLYSKRVYRPQRVDASEYNNKWFKYDLASFCGLMLSSRIVDTVGLPLEKYFIWCDDTEYSIRIRNHSSIINVNSALLTHKSMGIDYEAVRIHWKMYYSFRNRLDLVHRHYSVFAVFAELLRILHIALQNLQLFKHRKTWGDGKYNIKLCVDAIHDFLCDNYGKNNKYL